MASKIITHEDALAYALEMAAENDRLKHRVDELLGTCNKYLQEAREARAALRAEEAITSALRERFMVLLNNAEISFLDNDALKRS